MKDDRDHFVYEYSEYCPTCKKISPIMGAFARAVQEKGKTLCIIGLGLSQLDFVKIDANKNRVQGQSSSPYIPNILYYKNEWKKFGPVRFPIDQLGTQGLLSLYAFCVIIHDIQNLDWKHIHSAIESAKQTKEKIKELI